MSSSPDMTHILPGFSVGATSGAIILFLSHVAPLVGGGNFIRDIDRPTLFGRAISRREAHFVGIFVHIAVSALFGALFGLLVDQGIVYTFSFLPLLGWGVVLGLVTGAIILPLEGHGFFGLKEDAWFPADLFLTNVLWAVLMWSLMSVWNGLALR